MARRRSAVAGEDSPGLSASENRHFALVVGGAFLALAALGRWRGHPWLMYAAGSSGVLLALAGILIPHHLGPVNRTWMAMAESIAKVTTPIIMGVIYLLVITPAGVLRRTLGDNPIDRQADRGSFWINRDRPDSDLHRQF